MASRSNSPRTSDPAVLPRALVILLLGLGSSLSIQGLALALSNRVALRAVLGAGVWIEIAGLLCAVALGLVAFAGEIRAAWLRQRRTSLLAPLRDLFLVLVAAWILFLAFVQPFQRLWFDMALAAAAGAWAGLLVFEGSLARLPASLERIASIRRIGAPAAISACATVVLLEASLRALAEIRPSPLLVRVGDAPRAVLERFRCKPGEVRFGFPFNRGGHYDEEFYRKRAGQRLVASIGDSFSVGAVPHALHFTTVCEEKLGCPVANLGAPGIGPPEYLRLLVDEVRPLDPDLVVIDVFVGNDLVFPEVEKGLPDQGLRSFLQRDRVLVWVLSQRLLRIADEKRRQGRPPVGEVAVRSGRADASVAGGAGLERAFPWIADPSLEEGSMSEAAYLRLETQRAREICGAGAGSLAGFEDAMLDIKAAAGSTPLLVMLIPDEFQVEDDLWTAVIARTGADVDREWDRERPQRLVVPWLEQRGIPCLDLLPVLRATPPLADGRRHVYHLRDSHFNARGNRITGEELARFLARFSK